MLSFNLTRETERQMSKRHFSSYWIYDDDEEILRSGVDPGGVIAEEV